MDGFDYQTRPIVAADQVALWEAIYHAIFVPPGEDAPPRDVVRDPAVARYVENWGQVNDLGLLAIGAGEAVIGAAWIRLLKGNCKGYGYVDDQTPELSVAVWPEFRGRGVGTRLLSELLQRADERWSAVSLSVSKANPAVRLYRRLGFEPLADNGNTLVMRRPRSPET